MKSRFKVFLIIFIAFICFDKHINAQESTHMPGPQFAIVGQHPLLLNIEHKIDDPDLLNISSYQLGIETTWQPRKNRNIHYSFNLLYGTYFVTTQQVYLIDYQQPHALGWGKKLKNMVVLAGFW